MFQKVTSTAISKPKAQPGRGAYAKDVTEVDFIPYACHLNPETLITKNGEVLQVIALRTHYGVDETYGASPQPIREALRAALLEAFTDDRFACWLHTVRRRVPLSLVKAPKEGFARDVHRAWQKQHKWKSHFENTCYVTILREGQDADLFSVKDFKQGYSQGRNRRWRESYLAAAADELQRCTDRLLHALSGQMEATRLSIVERVTDDGVGAFSEPLELFHLLVNLEDQPIELLEADAAEMLCTHELTFGHNAVESHGEAGKSRFGAVFSLKAYRELPAPFFDPLLQFPAELVVSESFDCVLPAKSLAKQRSIQDMLDTAQDEAVGTATGLENLWMFDQGRAMDFGEHQISVMLLADGPVTLDQHASEFHKAAGELGLALVREDLLLEDSFWAQLPGNFEFLKRKHSLPLARAGGLMRLNRYPSGAHTQPHWGTPIALFPTRYQIPYEFHFHVEDNGHTVLFDYNSFPDQAGTALVHFLLSESMAHAPRVVMFDARDASTLFVQALGGVSHEVRALNPFALEDAPRNRGFLTTWLCLLAGDAAGEEEGWREQARAAVDAAYAQGQPTLESVLAQCDAALANRVRAVKSGALFSSEESIDWGAPLLHLRMKHLLGSDAMLPAFAYLLHRVIAQLDGRPTILVLQDAWAMLDNSFFAPRLESLLAMLRQRNCMMLLTTRRLDEVAQSALTPSVLQHTATRIYVPDDIIVDYRAEVCGLRADEVKLLKAMERQRGDFLVHQQGVGLPLRWFLGDEKLRAILTGDAKTLGGLA